MDEDQTEPVSDPMPMVHALFALQKATAHMGWELSDDDRTLTITTTLTADQARFLREGREMFSR